MGNENGFLQLRGENWDLGTCFEQYLTNHESCNEMALGRLILRFRNSSSICACFIPLHSQIIFKYVEKCFYLYLQSSKNMTYFWPMFTFCIHSKEQKTFGFVLFLSQGIKREHCLKMV